MPRELQSTLDAAGIEWPPLRNHMPCIAHVIQVTLGAFVSSLGGTGPTKSWEAHEHDEQFGENASIDFGKSQRLRKEGNARINMVLAMRPGLAKIIEKVRISWYFECPEADLHIVDNACWISYANTSSPKRAHWLSKCHTPNSGTSDYVCEDPLELYAGVARARLLCIGIHARVASKPKLQWLPTAIHNSGWLDSYQECHRIMEAISILDLLDVEEAFCRIASQYHCIQWHVRSHGWCDASCGQEEDWIEGRLVLRGEVSSTDAFQILRLSDSNEGHASEFRIHRRSCQGVAIV